MGATGERLIPESSDPDLRNEHFARYRFAEPLAAGRRVLDAGCGTGYGARILAASAHKVIAVDRAFKPLRDARDVYPGVAFLRADCADLPLTDQSIDLVVAFEVIEHTARWQDLLDEAGRVLTDPGILLVSTPNRSYYNTTRSTPNPYHVHEFDPPEFREALASRFSCCYLYQENHVPAVSLAASHSSESRAVFEPLDHDGGHAHFLVGVCSRRRIEAPPDLLYVPATGNVLRERELHIGRLNEWVRTLEDRHAQVQGRMSRELSRWQYRLLRKLRIAPPLPGSWSG